MALLRSGQPRWRNEMTEEGRGPAGQIACRIACASGRTCLPRASSRYRVRNTASK